MSHIILVIFAAGVLILPHLIPSHRNQVDRLEELIDRESRNLQIRRETIDRIAQARLIEDAFPKVEGAVVYRFDHRLEGISSVVAAQGDSQEGILLEIPGTETLYPAEDSRSPQIEVVNGVLILSEYRGGSLLQTQGQLGLDPASIGSFLIRMRVSAGDHFSIYWTEGNEFSPATGIQLPLAPPRDYHTYEIKEAIHSMSRIRNIGRIDRIFLVPSDQDADIEIEFLKITNRLASVCQRAAVDISYENIGGEIRRVLCTRSPSEITYTVTIPSESPLLLFGTSSSDPRIPVGFEIVLQEARLETVLFSEEAEGSEAWKDHKIDLASWSGRTVQIVFRTISELPNVGFWSNPILLDASQRRPNVVIYLVDALRPDHLRAYGYDRNISPFLDSFASRGALFANAYSNGCTTRHSIPSLFTSNPISATGVWKSANLLPETFPTLAEILRGMGYTTAAFTTNVNVGPFSGTHQGFSQLFQPQWFKDEDEGGGVPDKESVDVDAEVLIGEKLERWLEDNAYRGFFLYIHTVDAHGPYDPPEEYRTYLEKTGRPVPWVYYLDPPWLTNPTLESRLALYDGEIAYGDVYFGRFLDKLEDLGILENTLILFTADHGEYLGEHGLWSHISPPFVQGTHIPFVMVWPSMIPAGLCVTQNVQLLDVMPTILDAVGLGAEHLLLQGKSLLPLLRGQSEHEFEERAIYVEGDRPGAVSIHLSHFHSVPEKNLLFDLASDPEEERYVNRFIFDFGLKSRLRKLARTYRDTYAALKTRMASSGEETVPMDPETLKQLRALGYLE